MDYDTGNVVLGIAVNLIITGAFYMAPLLIYRFFIYKNKLPKNLALKACIISAIVMYLIVFVMYVATETDGAPNMKAAFLYTFIAYLIIRERNSVIEVKGDLKNQIRQYIDFYAKVFPVKRPDTDENLKTAVSEMFSEMMPYLNMIPYDQLAKEMKKQKLNVEILALNVIQNYAMMDAKETVTSEDVLFGISIKAEADIAVYKYINDIKLEKKYISQMQYDENERLITAIRYNAPFI